MLVVLISVLIGSVQIIGAQTLPNRTLISFSARIENNIIVVNGTLSASHTYDKVIIEKGSSATVFTPLTEIDVHNTANESFTFSYNDAQPINESNFYRVRMTNLAGYISELSTVLLVKGKAEASNKIIFNNTVLNSSNPTLSIVANKETTARVELMDMLGNSILSLQRKLEQGANNLLLPNTNLKPGIHFICITTDKEVIRQRILIQ